MRIGLILVVLVAALFVGGCYPIFKFSGGSKPVIRSETARPGLNGVLAEEAGAVRPLAATTDVVAIKYYVNNVGWGPFELFHAERLEADEDSLYYPVRLDLAGFAAPMSAVVPRYTAVIAFAEGSWPTALSGAEPPDFVRLELVFRPRRMSYDDYIAAAAGLRTGNVGVQGHRGVPMAANNRFSLWPVLDTRRRAFIRHIEHSRRISRRQKAMVFAQLIDLLNHERQALADEGWHGELVEVADLSIFDFEEALRRVERP